MATLTMCGIWVADHIVKSPIAVFGWTRIARGSMAFGMARWMT